VRTGIHIGEVTERAGSGSDVEGLAVDVAARIAGLARPAQVLTSASVADSARPRVGAETIGRPIRWQSHGSYRLKGLDEALEIREVGVDGIAPFAASTRSDKAVPARPPGTRRWALPATIASFVVLGGAVALLVRSSVRERPNGARPSAGVEAPAADALAIPAFAGRPAIAVLPLDNLSPDPAQACFADGLAEDLITRLSAWRAFPVIARNSSFKFNPHGVP
jgi:hypothetical protein